MDVISMHQAGIQNVVASSGTALTEGQIRLIRRFTQNVIVVYDADAAGIKASLRGIDMLLAEGLNIKVLQLPEGEDPDSYSQSHSSTEVEDYIKQHQTDFIRFKVAILLQGTENDPVQRSKVITDIVRSISVIPDSITRNVYIRECSHLLDIDDKVLALQVERKYRERLIAGASAANTAAKDEDVATTDTTAAADTAKSAATSSTTASTDEAAFMRPYERRVLRYVLKYGMAYLCDQCDEAGNTTAVNVIDYVTDELAADNMAFSNADFAHTFDTARSLADNSWANDFAAAQATAEANRTAYLAEVDDKIRAEADSTATVNKMLEIAQEKASDTYKEALETYASSYIDRALGSSPDDVVRTLTTDLVSERYQLSKIHTKYASIETEQDRLPELVPRAIYEWKDAILEWRQRAVIADIRRASAAHDTDAVHSLMIHSQELQRLRSELARYMGERTLSPRK
jgi:DNA primase